MQIKKNLGTTFVLCGTKQSYQLKHFVCFIDKPIIHFQPEFGEVIVPAVAIK